jgi:hypothetical protein
MLMDEIENKIQLKRIKKTIKKIMTGFDIKNK